MPYTSAGTGYRRTDTSHEAARQIEPKAATLRAEVLDVLKRHPRGLDCDEVAEKLGRYFGSVRPRITELKNDGLIVDSGRRSESRWGKKVIVWLHKDNVPGTQGDLFGGQG